MLSFVPQQRLPRLGTKSTHDRFRLPSWESSLLSLKRTKWEDDERLYAVEKIPVLLKLERRFESSLESESQDPCARTQSPGLSVVPFIIGT